jgi:mannose-6-phosphate isomerase-like protein (cupin superfamily)
MRSLWRYALISESDKVMTSEIWPPQLDALIAAPSNHRLLLENDRVRVLDTEILPGEKTPVHTHQWPAVHYVLSWSAFIRRDDSGSVLLDTRTTALAQSPPQVLWGEPLAAHSLENVGDTSLHIISVEQKVGSR